MNIKTTVDNNFFDRYEHFPDDEIKKRIKNAFISKRLSFYPSIQLIEELLALYHTQRKRLLPEYCNTLLNMIHYRVFNNWNIIIRHELGLIRGEGVFLESGRVKEVKKILEDLSQGIIPDKFDDLLDKVKQEKENWFKIYKNSQNYFLERVKNEKVIMATINFDEFYKKDFAVKIRMDLTKGIFERAGVQISDTKVNKILNHNKQYPYYHTFLKVSLGLFYRQTVLRRRVSKGDAYDQYYLVYLTNLDYLVSDDKRMKELADIVFTESQKVINFDDLIRIIQS